jgi:hypothetical protein
MAAHLADESRLAEIPELEPTLVRWAPPAGAPAHLRVSIDRLRAATREETLLVVSPAQVPAELLERLSDVRRTGATILALDRGDPELGALAHEALAVPPETSPLSFDAAQHLVSAAAGEPYGPRPVSHRGLLASMSSMPGGPARAGGPGGTGGTGGTRAGGGPGRHAPASSGHSLRSRLAQLLDAVSGTPASPSD